MANTQDPIQFLTLQEAHLIDGAALSKMDKFMTRITVSSLRVIIKIAEDLKTHGEALTANQIVEWIESDALIRKQQGEEIAFLKWDSPYPDLDFEDPIQDEVTTANLSSHEKFLTRMVISSMQVLKAIAQTSNIHIENLSLTEIIAWTEAEAKTKLETIQ
jgi:uncharacterized metal-binding protein